MDPWTEAAHGGCKSAKMMLSLDHDRVGRRRAEEGEKGETQQVSLTLSFSLSCCGPVGTTWPRSSYLTRSLAQGGA